MSLSEVTAAVEARVGEESGLNATLKFDLGDDGVVFVDGTATPNVVNNEDQDADCTIRLSLEHMQAIIAGDMDPMTAFMMGRLKVEGSMGIAMKLQSVLGS